MVWIWQDDDDDVPCRSGDNPSRSSAGDGGECATRKVVRTQCRIEESEPGKFVRKCEKTEEIFKDCVGRLPEMVQSNKEYTEEDVTNQMNKGFALPALESSHQTPFDFPGLRSDIEAMERNFFTGLDRFFGAAEDTMNGFFGSFGIPRVDNGDQSSSARTRGIPVYNGDQSSSARTRGIPVERNPPKEPSTEVFTSDAGFDFSGQSKEV